MRPLPRRSAGPSAGPLGSWDAPPPVPCRPLRTECFARPSWGPLPPDAARLTFSAPPPLGTLPARGKLLREPTPDDSPGSDTVLRGTARSQVRRAAPLTGVRIRAGILASGPGRQAAEVDLPTVVMMLALLVVGQVRVAQHDTGPAIFWLQRNDDARGARRHGGVVRPTPGEHQPVRRANLNELTGRFDAAAHQDAVGAARYRLQRRAAAHPLDVAAGVGEIGKHRLG